MLKAFLDGKTFITINSDKESAFYLNGEPLSSYFVSCDNDVLVYKANHEVILGKSNIISDNFNNKVELEIRNFVKDNEFDEMFFYDLDDLGSTYNKKYCEFKLWAPTAISCQLKYEIKGHIFIEDMERIEKGVYYIKVNKDLKGALYTYLVNRNGEVKEVIDPYSYSTNENTLKSGVIDLNDIKDDDVELSKLDSIAKAIIYEMSVRDFSMDDLITNKEKGTFEAMCKTNLKSPKGNKIGLDYLVDLGITHIQLMPVLDFVTVNETNKFEKYNWGYDPACFNSLEGSYCSNPYNPIVRMQEFKKLVETYHKANIRVNLDLVINHTYYYNSSVYNDIIPYYFYLMDRHQNLSNGSFCGNDIDTIRAMARKYIKDMCKRLVSLYHVDGFRFDLMGIIEKSLINEIYQECKKLNPSFIIYGEGWDMPSLLDNNLKASIANHKHLPQVAFFNDFFRDSVSGKVNNENSYKLGYLSGNLLQASNFIKAMKGSVDEGCYFEVPTSSINYVECHDNYTLYDKLAITRKNLSIEDRNKITLTMIASILLAQGVPFIHLGMEFARSKKQVENSYKSDDSINMVHWENVDKYQSNIKAVKDFISIRKEFGSYLTKASIKKNIDGRVLDDGIVQLTYVYNGRVVVLIFNPNQTKKYVKLNGHYSIIANQYGKVNDESFYDEVKVSSYGFTMLSR